LLKYAKETNQVSAAHIAALGQISKEAKTLCLFALVGWGIEKRAGAASSQQPAGLQPAQRAQRAQPAQPAQRAQQRPATLGATSPYAAVSSYVGPTYHDGAPLHSAPAAGAVPPRVVPESVVDI